MASCGSSSDGIACANQSTGQSGAAVLSVDGSVGAPSAVSSLNMKPAIRSSPPSCLGPDGLTESKRVVPLPEMEQRSEAGTGGWHYMRRCGAPTHLSRATKRTASIQATRDGRDKSQPSRSLTHLPQGILAQLLPLEGAPQLGRDLSCQSTRPRVGDHDHPRSPYFHRPTGARHVSRFAGYAEDGDTAYYMWCWPLHGPAKAVPCIWVVAIPGVQVSRRATNAQLSLGGRGIQSPASFVRISLPRMACPGLAKSRVSVDGSVLSAERPELVTHEVQRCSAADRDRLPDDLGRAQCDERAVAKAGSG